MQFQSIAEEIKYLYKQIIFTYIRNQHLYYLELANNGVFHEKNRIIVRCDKYEFIKQYVKELFPAPEIQSTIYTFSNWYLIDFGVRLNEGLNTTTYRSTSEVVELIYKNPMRYFVEYNLWSVYLWFPYGLESYVSLTDITEEQREVLNSTSFKWTWTGDVFTFYDEEMAVKCLRAYMKALDHMLSLETNAVKLGY